MAKSARKLKDFTWSGERRSKRIGTALAALFLLTTHAPGVMVLAAPQYFVRAGAGVNNLPLEVLAFSNPGFGSVADAVNLATGNVYLDLGQVNRNNILNPTDDKTGYVANLHVNGIKRLNGFNRYNGTAPMEWALAQGDGSYQYFRRASDAEINAAPSWIGERYQPIRSRVTFYITKPQAGTQVNEEWLVWYQTNNGDYIAMHYDHGGNRTTFYSDGEYEDYVQNPYEQYVTARDYGDADGKTANARRTQFTYNAGSGRVTQVKDAWGRTTDYVWDTNNGYVTDVKMLLQSDGRYAQTIHYDYAVTGDEYAVTGNQHVVSKVSFSTFDGRGSTISRAFKFDYGYKNGQVLLTKVTRPVVSGGSPEVGNTVRVTTFGYDDPNNTNNTRVTRIQEPGLPDVVLTYSTTNPNQPNGLDVTRVQGDKQTVLNFTAEGWLRSRNERITNMSDYEYGEGQNYWYDATGHLLATGIWTGVGNTKQIKQYQYTYDNHGNQLTETIYNGKAINWSDPPPAGYLRSTTTAYNSDNQPTSIITRAEKQSDTLDGDASYAYAQKQLTISYSYHPTVSVSGLINFKAVNLTSNATVIGTTTRSVTQRAYDAYGRLTDESLFPAGLTNVYKSWGYDANALNAPVNGYVYHPTSIADGFPTTAGRLAYYYGDMPIAYYFGGSAWPRDKNYSYTYDELGNTAVEIQQDAVVTAWVGTTPTKRSFQIHHSYDGFGNMVAEAAAIHTPNVLWETAYSRQWIYYPSGELKASWEGTPSNVTEYKYSPSGDTVGWLTTTRRGAGANGAVTDATIQSTTTLDYDAYGRIFHQTVNGNTTTFTYDTLDRPFITYFPDGSKKTQWYNRADNPSSPSDINDTVTLTDVPVAGSQTSTTRHTFDPLGRETKTTLPNGATIVKVYDPFDNVIKITDNRLTMNADGASRSTYLKYDEMGNLLKKLDPSIVTDSTGYYTDSRRPYTEFQYNAENRVISKTQLLSGSVTPEDMQISADSITATTKTTYDLFGNVLSVTDPEGYTTTNTFDNTDHITSTTNQVFKVNTSPSGTSYEIAKQYAENDAAGRAGFTNNSVTTRVAYNGLGQKIQEVDARGNSKYTFYNILGLPVSLTDERGITIKKYTYTADGLLERTLEPKPGTTTGEFVTAEFRKYANSPYPSEISKATMDTEAGSSLGTVKKYSYDYAGRDLITTLPDGSTIEKTYDSGGNVIKLQDQYKRVTSSTYDYAGRILTRKNSRYSNVYEYNKMGDMTYRFDKGLHTYFTYNSLGKVISESRPTTNSTPTYIKQLTNYRLDGVPTSQTGFSGGIYSTDFPRIWMVDGSPQFALYKSRIDKYYDKAGREIQEIIGTVYNWKKYYDGLGNLFQRTFIGDLSTYASQYDSVGTNLKHANYLSYYVYDQNSNLVEKWDTPMNGTSGIAYNSQDRQNYFAYSYSNSNNETRQIKKLALREQPLPSSGGDVVGSSELYGIAKDKGILLAGVDSTITTTYDDRDKIKSVLTDEKTPATSSVVGIDSQGTLGDRIIKTATYTYYYDGSEKRVEVSIPQITTSSGVKSDQTTLRYKDTLYDNLGRISRVTTQDGVTKNTYGTSVESLRSEVYKNGSTATSFVRTESYDEDQNIITTTTSDGAGSYYYTPSGKVDNIDFPPYQIDTPHTFNLDLGFFHFNFTWHDIASHHNVYKYTYDDFQNLLSVTNTDNGVPQGTIYSASYLYGTNNADWETFNGVKTSYTYNWRGMRLSATGGDNNGFTKRYNAEDEVAQYDKTNIPNTRQIEIRRNNFVYDPQGRNVFSSTAGIRNQADPVDKNGVGQFFIDRDMNSANFVNDDLQSVTRRGGGYSRYSVWRLFSYDYYIADSYSNNGYQLKDTTYSLAVGYNDKTQWSGTLPFAIYKPQLQPLDAPVQSLSNILKIDPLAVGNPQIDVKLPDPSKISTPPIGQAGNQGTVIPPSQTRLTIPAPVDQKQVDVKPEVAPLSIETTQIIPDNSGFDIPIYALASSSTSPAFSISGSSSLTGSYYNQTSYIGLATGAINYNYQADVNEASMLLRSVGATYMPSSKYIINGVIASSSILQPVMRPTFLYMLAGAVGSGRMTDAALGMILTNFDTLAALQRSHPEATMAIRSTEAYLMLTMAAYDSNNYMGAWMGALTNEYGRGLKSVNDDPKQLLYLAAFEALGAEAIGGKIMGKLYKMLPAKAKGVVDRGLRYLQQDVRSLRLGCKSFTPNTPVRTLSGLVAISALTVGTPVLAFNEQTGQNGYYPITQVHRNLDPTITYLTIKDPEQANQSEFITTTPEHPFYVKERSDNQARPKPVGHEDLNSNWVGAGHLKVGDKIKQADGTTGVVANVTTIQQTQEMFNLTVSEAHTFYVGTNGWLVHNGCGNAALGKLPINSDRGRFYMSAEELLNQNNIILKHPTNDLQRFGGPGLEAGHNGVRNLSNEELLRFGGPNGTDPISGFRSYAPGDSSLYPGSRIHVEAGHHRLEEILRRIQNGTLDPKTIIEVKISGGK